MPTKPPAVHMDFLCNEAWLHPSQHHQRHQHPRLINRRSSITSLWVQLDISVILEMVDMLCITTLLSMVWWKMHMVCTLCRWCNHRHNNNNSSNRRHSRKILLRPRRRLSYGRLRGPRKTMGIVINGIDLDLSRIHLYVLALEHPSNATCRVQVAGNLHVVQLLFQHICC